MPKIQQLIGNPKHTILIGMLRLFMVASFGRGYCNERTTIELNRGTCSDGHDSRELPGLNGWLEGMEAMDGVIGRKSL